MQSTQMAHETTHETAAEIMANVYDLMATSNRIGERYGWNDPRIAAIDADIARYTAQAEALRAAKRVA